MGTLFKEIRYVFHKTTGGYKFAGYVKRMNNPLNYRVHMDSRHR